MSFYIPLDLFNDELEKNKSVLNEKTYWQKQYKFVHDLLSFTIAKYIQENLCYYLDFLHDYPSTNHFNSYHDKTTLKIDWSFDNERLLYVIKINQLINLTVVLYSHFPLGKYQNAKEMTLFLIHNRSHIVKKIQEELDIVLKEINDNQVYLKKEINQFLNEYISFEKTSYHYCKVVPELNVFYDFIPTITDDGARGYNETMMNDSIFIHYRSFYIWDNEKDVYEILFNSLGFHYVYTYNLNLDKLKESVLDVFYSKLKLMYQKTVVTLKQLINERYKDINIEFMDYDTFMQYPNEPMVYMNNQLVVHIFFKYEEYFYAKKRIESCLKLSKYYINFKYLLNRPYIFETNTVSFFITDEEFEEYLKLFNPF